MFRNLSSTEEDELDEISPWCRDDLRACGAGPGKPLSGLGLVQPCLEGAVVGDVDALHQEAQEINDEWQVPRSNQKGSVGCPARVPRAERPVASRRRIAAAIGSRSASASRANSRFA